MKKLSSDYLWYKSFASTIVVSIIFFFIIKIFVTKNVTNTGLIIFYCALSLFIMFMCYRVYTYKQVLYDKTDIIIKTYLTKNQTIIPIEDILSVIKLKQLGMYPNVTESRYQLTYKYNKKILTVFFFKSLDNIQDVESYIGVKKD